MNAVMQLLRQRFEEQRASQAPSSAMVRVLDGHAAVVLDSPHGGIHYPADFAPACPMPLLRLAEDTHVERLFRFAPALGVAWVEALFARSYLDTNCAPHEIDSDLFNKPWADPKTSIAKVLSKVRLGKGLIWRSTDHGVPIYDRKLSVAEVQARIVNCWKPYHAAVEQAIERAHARHGYSIHINCHSMPAIAGPYASNFPGLEHADFVVGNRDETTSSPALGRAVCAHLKSLGYSVSYNYPYKGVELVRRYSDPSHHRHSIQLEINRKLYMNEQTLEITQGFVRLQMSLLSLVELLLRTDPRGMEEPRGSRDKTLPSPV